MSDYRYLVCLDMDRVLVDHLSTWQYVYDKLGISNDESFELYNQGLLDEWDWIKLDIALIKESQTTAEITDEKLRSNGRNAYDEKLNLLISKLIEDGAKVAIVSGGLQQTARDIAAQFPSTNLGKGAGAVSIDTPLKDFLMAVILNYQSLLMVG